MKKFYKRYKEIINYTILGIFITIISVESYATFRLYIPNYNVSTFLSWIATVLFVYVTSRIFVFESKNDNIKKELFAFITSRLILLAFEMLLMIIFITIFEINDLDAKLIIQIIIFILNYFISKKYIFKKNSKLYVN